MSLRAPDQPLSLLEMPSGCTLFVEELVGSASLRSRLYSMGILPGTEMELCRGGCGRGNVCVRVRQCSLVLGEAMARAIYCRPADGREHHRRHHHTGHGFRSFRHGDAAGSCCADITNQPRPDRGDGNVFGAKKDDNA